MEKLKLRQAVVVEGKYDKIKLSSLIDGTILCTEGFRIYKDKQRSAMIRAVAERQGLVILTDSDRAGFRIRNYLRSIAKGAEIINLYIPQVVGKERRKSAPGAEGFLGVEGIDIDTLRAIFEHSGLLADGEMAVPVRLIGRMDFFEDGLMGGEGSAEKRRALLRHLGLPGYLTTNSLLEIINSLMSWEEYRSFCGQKFS